MSIRLICAVIVGLWGAYGAEAEDNERPEKVITGYVVEINGDPVEGARVEARRTRRAAATSVARTDVNGRFGITGLDQPRYMLVVSADGFIGKTTIASAGARDVEVVLDRYGTIEGTVFDKETGEPIEEFMVAARRLAGETLPDAWPEWMVTLDYRRVSEPEGRYAIEDLRALRLIVVVRADGYAPAHLVVSRSGGEERLTGIDFHLQPGGAVIEGMVLNEAREAIPGAELKWAHPSWPFGPQGMGRHARLRQPFSAGYSGGDGAFRLSGLPPGEYTLIADHPEYTPVEIDVQAAEGPSHLYRLVLGTGASVRGVVLRNGEPSEETPVVVRTGDAPRSLPVKTGGGGTYRVAGVWPGHAEVSAYVEGASGKYRQYIRKLKLPADEELVVHFDIQETAVLEGRVTVDGAVPVRGEAALHIPAEDNRPPVERTAKFDEDGWYTLDDVPGGATGTLRVQTWAESNPRDGWGGLTECVEIVLPDDAVERHDVDLDSAGAMIYGAVRGLEERDSVAIVLLPADVYGERLSYEDVDVAYEQGDVVGETRVCGRGRRDYSIMGVPPGTYVIAAYTASERLSLPVGDKGLPTQQVAIGEDEHMRALYIWIPELVNP